MQTQFTDVTNLAKGLVLDSYNRFSSGNPELESAIAHNINLTYFSFNMFNYTNVVGNVSYTKNIDRIRSASQFEPGSVINFSSPFNSSFADESVTAFGRFERAFGKLRASARGTFNYSKFNQIINERVSINNNYTQNYQIGLRSNFKTAPNFDVKYDYSINDNQQGGNSSKFYTHAPSIEMDALLLKVFTFRTDYSFNDYRNEEASINTYEFWNASLSYRKNEDSKFEYQLKATNLLNAQSQNNTNVGNFSVSATEYFIQPRFLTFRVIYSL
jgi:hypothetical protein